MASARTCAKEENRAEVVDFIGQQSGEVSGGHIVAEIETGVVAEVFVQRFLHSRALRTAFFAAPAHIDGYGAIIHQPGNSVGLLFREVFAVVVGVEHLFPVVDTL